MSVPSAFVHIIESPSSSDLLDGRTEGRTLASFLELAGIPSVYSLASDEQTFNEALYSRLAKGVEQFDLPPIIHISAHGNQQGIELTNTLPIVWADLAEMLRPINSVLSDTLLVCLSTCQGASGGTMALSASKSLPMNGLIASRGNVGWHEAALGFLTFYHHLLLLGRPATDAVEAMKTAAGRDDFVSIEGERVRDVARQYASLTEEQRANVATRLRERRRIQS